MPISTLPIVTPCLIVCCMGNRHLINCPIVSYVSALPPYPIVTPCHCACCIRPTYCLPCLTPCLIVCCIRPDLTALPTYLMCACTHTHLCRLCDTFPCLFLMSIACCLLYLPWHPRCDYTAWYIALLAFRHLSVLFDYVCCWAK